MALLIQNDFLLLERQANQGVYALENEHTNRYKVFAMGANSIGTYKPGNIIILRPNEYDTIERDGNTYTLAEPADVVAIEVNRAA